MSSTSTNGVGSNGTGKWSQAYDELRSHQSLSSVINNPSPRLGLDWESIGNYWDKVREGVEDIAEQREKDAKAAAESTGIDVLLGQIPEVADFQPYLDSFSEVWKIYARNNKSKPGGRVHDHRDGEDDREAGDAHHVVPREYYRSDFKLEHHQIFRQSLQTSVEQQEDINSELTGHMDMIEVSLFEQVRRAQRDQKFDSLASLGEPLQEDLISTLSVVTSLRSQLHSVQRQQLVCGLRVGRLARRKKRLADVLQRLDCLAHVQQSQPNIQVLLQGRDYVTALDLLESTKSAVDSNLKGLVSIKPVVVRLTDIGDTFNRAVEADFVHHSTEAILAPAATGTVDLQEVRGAERLRRLCGCLVRRGLLKAALSSTLRNDLLAQLKKVLKSGARTLLEDAAKEQGKSQSTSPPEPAVDEPEAQPSPTGSPTPAVREPAPDGDALAGAGISGALCSLSFEAFLEFWKQTVQNCVGIASRFCDYAVLMQGAASDAQLPDAGASGGPREAEVANELLRLFEVIMNSLLQKVGVLLQARKAEHQTLKVPQWQRLLECSNECLDKVKGLKDTCKQRLSLQETHAGGDIGNGLRAILHEQTKAIVEDFHMQRVTQMQSVLEQERWERIDVPEPYVKILDQLLGNGQQVAVGADERQDKVSFLKVDGQNFVVVPAVLTLIQLLTDYVQVCQDLHILAVVIVEKLVHLLRLFNQQTQKLVLLGQAVQKGVRQSITAANLALCSQTCWLVAQILPKMRMRVLRVLQESLGLTVAEIARHPAALLLGDLEKIATEYTDHRTLLFGKLSDLLRDRYEHHARKWLATAHSELKPGSTAWITGPIAGAESSQAIDLSPHEALEALVKEYTTMYRVLLRSIDGAGVRNIFSQAFTDIAEKFEQRLDEEMSASSPPYGDAPGYTVGDRLTMDVAYLQEQLGKLSGITTPLQQLLFRFVQHLRSKLPTEDPVRAVHPSVPEALQRAGKLPR